jgi:hypothetical protein
MAATQNFKYQAFGLSFQSELVIPEFLPLPEESHIEIDIRLDAISPKYFENTSRHGFWHPTPQYFVLDVPDTARYLVEQGRRITIEPTADSDANNIRLFLLGTCLGVIFHQRGLFPVHGSAVSTPNGCVIFAGQIGAGKSSLAAAFYTKGYEILADDISVLKFHADRNVSVVPSFPQIKLNTDVARILGINTARLDFVGSNTKKIKLPIHEQFHRTPERLLNIFFIESHEENVFQIMPVTGLRKFTLVGRNTYRKSLLEGLGQTCRHFQQCELLNRMVDMKTVKRPAAGLRLLELTEFLESQLDIG